jgi:hypothetical protein
MAEGPSPLNSPSPQEYECAGVLDGSFRTWALRGGMSALARIEVHVEGPSRTSRVGEWKIALGVESGSGNQRCHQARRLRGIRR